jgi:cytochrome o ubiquinol oxidase operon protein cyoD
VKNEFNEIDLKESRQGHGSYKSYLIGFAASIALTLLAFLFVEGHHLSGWALNTMIITLCVLQVLVQLVFFLHLGDESKPYWNLICFLFMVMVVAIIVLGSIWIIFDLDSRMMRGIMRM